MEAEPSGAEGGAGQVKQRRKAEIVFLGTGTSSGVPLVSCLTSDRCQVCPDAMRPGSKNRRRNTCILIRFWVPRERRSAAGVEDDVSNHTDGQAKEKAKEESVNDCGPDDVVDEDG